MRIFILTIFLIIGISACQKTSYEILVLNGLTMGTTYSVKINADNAFVEKNKISNDIDEILSEINQSMSTYIKESELSNINYSTISDWQSISDDLFEVINHAINVSLKTNGAFDITIAPLVNLWGFGPDKLQNKIPTDEIIELTKKNTGYKKISIDKSLKMISKLDPNLHIDLSGIAKGFAVDKIARYLDKCGFKNYLVEIGGELIGKGLNKDKEIWQIGIDNPNNNSDRIKRIIQLEDMAMATSGNYMNYFEKDGIRYSHTINPVTGRPIKHKLASVTVLDSSTMNADALATAFMVLGPEKALSLANNLEIALYLIIKNGERFEEKYNDYFMPYLSD
jgi:thiamine biosynthesis lipoprotein